MQDVANLSNSKFELPIGLPDLSLSHNHSRFEPALKRGDIPLREWDRGLGDFGDQPIAGRNFRGGEVSS